jgi:hypothetical protein
MTEETETENVKEPIASIPPTEEVKEPPKMGIKSEKDLMRFWQILDGQNPDAQQTMNDFLDMRNIIERTNLSTRRDIQLIVYLDMCSEYYFSDSNNPFAKLRDSLARGFLAKGGFKSNQFVELMRNQPDLSGMQTSSEYVKQGIFDRILRRGKTE